MTFPRSIMFPKELEDGIKAIAETRNSTVAAEVRRLLVVGLETEGIKTGKTETHGMVQTAVWLPKEMHKQLKDQAGHRGLGEHMRLRLEHSVLVAPILKIRVIFETYET